jgi:CheY-like chemotaxis protein
MSNELNNTGQPPCPNVLVIEDHEDTLTLLKLIIEGAGHHVKVASDGHEALAILQNHSFDFIVSDLGLPGMSGLQLMRLIRERHDTPAIALSGYGMAQDRAASLAAGFNEHVLKPINPDALLAAIHRVCQQMQPS